MRIRSIRPEFWTSEDITALTWDQRLIYIGLWSYVDDNGVGRDVERLIAADLFPLEDNTHGVLKKIAGALSEYSRRQMITRYEVGGKRFLHITAWQEHQKINRPSDGRYPLPTRADAVIHDILTEPSVSPHANVPLGEGEKGRRGEEKRLGQDFADWWQHYPRKVGRGTALKAYTDARQKTDADTLLSAVKEFADQQRDADPKFIPHGSTWLNGERWLDSPDPESDDARPEWAR